MKSLKKIVREGDDGLQKEIAEVKDRLDNIENRLDRIEAKVSINNENRISRLEDTVQVIKTKLKLK